MIGLTRNFTSLQGKLLLILFDSSFCFYAHACVWDCYLYSFNSSSLHILQSSIATKKSGYSSDQSLSLKFIWGPVVLYYPRTNIYNALLQIVVDKRFPVLPHFQSRQPIVVMDCILSSYDKAFTLADLKLLLFTYITIFERKCTQIN